MRTLLPAILALLVPALPAFAHETVVNACVIDAAQPCALEIDLPDFQPLGGDPVVIDGTVLKLIGADARGQVRTVQIFVSDGTILAEQPFDLVLADPEYRWAMIAPDGKTIAIHLWDGSQDRGIQFYNAYGNPLGLVKGGADAAWAYDENTATETLGIFGEQGLLTFNETEMRVSFYRFEMAAQVADGHFELRELSPPQNESDTLQAYLERRFWDLVGPGAETVNWQGNLEAVIIAEGDGQAEELMVRSRHGQVMFDQRLSVDRDDYTLNSRYHYSEAYLSPKARQLAVIRFGNGSADAPVQLMVFDVRTTFPVFTAPLAGDEDGRPASYQTIWISDSRVGVLRTLQDGDSRLFVFDLPGGG
jgi:hypothetical protein